MSHLDTGITCLCLKLSAFIIARFDVMIISISMAAKNLKFNPFFVRDNLVIQYRYLDSLISKVIVVSCLQTPGQVFFRQDLNMHSV